MTYLRALVFFFALAAPAIARAQGSPPPLEETAHFAIRPTFAGNIRTIYGSSAYTGELAIAFGAASKHIGFFIGLGAARGQTGSGLGVQNEFLSLLGEGAFGRFRVGGEIRAGSYGVRRVTDDSSMSSAYVGVGLHGSYDVARYTDRAIMLGAALRVDPLPGNDAPGPVIWGPTVFVGARL